MSEELQRRPPETAVAPQTLGDIKELVSQLPPDDPFRANLIKATVLCQAAGVPDNCKGKPLNLFFLLQRAQELEFPWGYAMEVLYATPGGRIGMESKAMRARLVQAGCYFQYTVDKPEHVEFMLRRPITGDDQHPLAYTSIWTAKRAAETKIWIKGTQTTLLDKWNRHGQNIQNMLRQRATAEAAREIASDIIGGMYTRDEVIDIEAQPVGEDPIERADRQEQKQSSIDETMVSIEWQQRINDAAYKAGDPEAGLNKMLELQEMGNKALAGGWDEHVVAARLEEKLKEAEQDFTIRANAKQAEKSKTKKKSAREQAAEAPAAEQEDVRTSAEEPEPEPATNGEHPWKAELDSTPTQAAAEEDEFEGL